VETVILKYKDKTQDMIENVEVVKYETEMKCVALKTDKVTMYVPIDNLLGYVVIPNKGEEDES